MLIISVGLLHNTHHLQELKGSRLSLVQVTAMSGKKKRRGFSGPVDLRVVRVCQWFHEESLIALMGDYEMA